MKVLVVEADEIAQGVLESIPKKMGTMCCWPEGGGTQFDPALVQAFFNVEERFAEIRQMYDDQG
jgi:hypothetical protein